MLSEIESSDGDNTAALTAASLSFKDTATHPAMALALDGLHPGSGAAAPLRLLGPAGLVRMERHPVSSTTSYTLEIDDPGAVVELIAPWAPTRGPCSTSGPRTNGAVTLLVDRCNHEVTVWRNGEQFDDLGDGDLTDIDEPANYSDATPIPLVPGQTTTINTTIG